MVKNGISSASVTVCAKLSATSQVEEVQRDRIARKSQEDIIKRCNVLAMLKKGAAIFAKSRSQFYYVQRLMQLVSQ